MKSHQCQFQTVRICPTLIQNSLADISFGCIITPSSLPKSGPLHILLTFDLYELGDGQEESEEAPGGLLSGGQNASHLAENGDIETGTAADGEDQPTVFDAVQTGIKLALLIRFRNGLLVYVLAAMSKFLISFC